MEAAAVDFLACASVKKKYVPPGAKKGAKHVLLYMLVVVLVVYLSSTDNVEC